MRKVFKRVIPLLIALFLLTAVVINWQNLKPKVGELFTVNLTQKENTPLSKIIPEETEISILIDKSDYQLHIYASDTLVKTFPVVLGGNPFGDKLREGDQCTPEGNFKIVDKYPHKTWSKFIWINYPTDDSWRKHNKAKADGIIPKNATIGGEIGIHGVPKDTDVMIETGVNWTLGCISLTNAAVNEIYPFITDKTVIKIQK